MRLFLVLILYGAIVAGAWAQSRDPLGRPLRDYGVVLAMTLLGGFAGWYRKVVRGDVQRGSFFALIGELTTSALAGMVCFFCCDYAGLPIDVAAAACGLAGHMGGRAIEFAERAAQRRADRLLKGDQP